MKKYKVKGVNVASKNTYYPNSIDIESQLTRILSEQSAIEIDRGILSRLDVFERPMRRKKSINKIYK